MKGKKLLVMAGLLALPGMAFAQGGMEGGTQGGMEEGQHGQYGQKGQHGMMQGQSAQMFKNQKNFRVEGTVTSVDPTQRQITVQREGLPPAELMVASDTQVKVNGKQSSLSQIQPGDEVRAEFNLAENQAIAVSLDAKEGKATKGMREGESKKSQPGY